jgi:hypothetical protein
MIRNHLRIEDLRLTQDGTKVRMAVPWRQAGYWQEYLRARGVSSTLFLDPVNRDAHLEPWTYLSTDRIRKLLAGEEAGPARALPVSPVYAGSAI